MADTEEAIARVQTEAANTQGVQKHHKTTLVYIGERIVTYLFGLAFISLVVAWLTAPYKYFTYLVIIF